MLHAIEPSDYSAAAALLVALPITLWLRGRRRAGAAQLTWIAALLLVSVPFTDLQSHTHWAKVAWIPFVSPPVKLTDIVANVLLYFPLGYVQPPGRSRRRLLIRSALIAGAIALVAETTQLFSHGRLPSSTDLVCDVVGALAGTLAQIRSLKSDV